MFNMLMRVRFRISSLFWLMALVASFFLGQRYDAISVGFDRWWQVTRVRLGGDVRANEHVVMWPRRSATINEQVAIKNVSVGDISVCTASEVTERQLRIMPASDGKTFVCYTRAGQSRPCRFDVTVENGKITDWMLSGPPRSKANQN